MILISPDRFKLALLQLAKQAGVEYLSFFDSRTTKEIPEVDTDILISFQSGLILPEKTLNAYKCYNFHAASPDFPGRDPHHWAIYRKAKEFGVTLHEMTKRVDEGRILAVSRFDIEPGITPEKLRKQAEAMSVWMFGEMLPQILAGNLAPNSEEWGTPKNTRQGLLDLISGDITERERFAFSGFL